MIYVVYHICDGMTKPEFIYIGTNQAKGFDKLTKWLKDNPHTTSDEIKMTIEKEE